MSAKQYGIKPLVICKEIKSIVERRFSVENSEDNEQISLCSVAFKDYNEMGYITKQSFYYSNEMEQMITYKYDEYNNLKALFSNLGFTIQIDYNSFQREVKTLNYYEKECIPSETHFFYNAENLLEKEIIKQKQQDTIHHYKYKSGELIGSSEYNGEELISEWYIESSECKSTQTVYNIEPKYNSKSRSVLYLDDRGNVVKNESFNAEGQLVQIRILKYDRNSTIVLSEVSNISKNNKCKKIKRTEDQYEYDKNENWIKKIRYSNGIKTEYKEREITYF